MRPSAPRRRPATRAHGAGSRPARWARPDSVRETAAGAGRCAGRACLARQHRAPLGFEARHLDLVDVAGLDAALAVLRHRVGRHRDDAGSVVYACLRAGDRHPRVAINKSRRLFNDRPFDSFVHRVAALGRKGDDYRPLGLCVDEKAVINAAVGLLAISSPIGVLPVVVKAGHNFVSRMGASFMTAAGLPEWVAADDDAYVAIAQRIAQGDLTGQIVTSSNDEVGRLMAALADMQGSLSRMVAHVRQNSESLDTVRLDNSS